MGNATSRTTRELRTAGAAAALFGLLYLALPGVPAGCWLATRVLPAIPLVAVGVIMIALGAWTYRLDQQADEVDALSAQIASAHAMPAIALAEPGAQRGRRWTMLPFFGLFLAGLALSAFLRGSADCAAPAPTSGAAVGLAVAAAVTVALGLSRYRAEVATGAARVEALRREAGSRGPSA